MSQITTILLLTISNVFMTFAWYGHLKNLTAKPIYYVVIISWFIAFFEYCFQVPANRIGFEFFSLSQLKIIQEVISLIVFVLFSFFFMKEKININLLWASFCLLGAVYFIFKEIN